MTMRMRRTRNKTTTTNERSGLGQQRLIRIGKKGLRVIAKSKRATIYHLGGRSLTTRRFFPSGLTCEEVLDAFWHGIAALPWGMHGVWENHSFWRGLHVLEVYI